MKGLDVFRSYFSAYQDQYVLIGGAACDILFEQANAPFRATKDLDMVLVVEALTPEFGRQFWRFIRDGGYEHRAKSNGSPQFYRFDKPKAVGFPFMIELFSRIPGVFHGELEGPCTPMPLGEEISSLSAILLDADYYELLLQGRVEVDSLMVLSPPCLILFKAKAFLELRARRAEGAHVDQSSIQKHKNDIVRLATILTGRERCELPGAIQQDLERFLTILAEEPVDLKSMRLGRLQMVDVITRLRQVFVSHTTVAGVK